MKNKSEQDPHMILGSDGAGIIEKIGEGVKNVTVQTEVVIFPTLNWDLTENVPPVPEILGGPSDGTLAEYVIIPSQNAIKKTCLFILGRSGRFTFIRFNCISGSVYKGAIKKKASIY